MYAQKNDFVEIKYTGRLEDGSIFDLNDKEQAEKEKIKGHIHERTVICLGTTDLVSGLDTFLIGKEIGKKLHTTIPPEEGFGKKDPKLLQMLPLNKFQRQNINPIPGLQVTVDNNSGTVKSISGGRILVDFNHPLAGKTLLYEITMVRKVDSLKEKVLGFLELNVHMHNLKGMEKDGTVIIETELPKELHSMLETELKKRIPELQGLRGKSEEKEGHSN